LYNNTFAVNIWGLGIPVPSDWVHPLHLGRYYPDKGATRP
jgi:hypothetical protein